MSLHDALPLLISRARASKAVPTWSTRLTASSETRATSWAWRRKLSPILAVLRIAASEASDSRSEEHTSELQSLMRISYAVLCLKKKNKNKQTYSNTCSRQHHPHH